MHADDPELLALRQPPHSTEAEQSLIGAMLLDNSAFERVCWLAEDAFYEDRHRRLWRGISRLIDQAKVADLVTLPEALGKDLEKAGGTAYIGALMQNTPSATHANRYAQIVRDKAVLRRLASTCSEVAEIALDGGTQDVGRILDEAEGRFLRIGEEVIRTSATTADLQTILSQVMERVDHQYQREDKNAVTGVATGFVDLDEKTDGFQDGDLIIIAGRPSMGKTAFALNIAEHAAMVNSLPVVVFSMEMSGNQLGTRLLGSVAKVDQHRMRSGHLTDEDWTRLTGAMERLHAVPIEVDEAGALTVLEVRARARRLRRKHGKLGMVIVDYLQLMEAPRKGENRATDVSEMTRALKAMAKELQCPVVALSQLNRALDQRGEKRPMMSDLRESGAIEQDADVIIFLYRDEVYFPEKLDNKGFAEAIISKQRNGPIGTVNLTFIGQYTRFENFAGEMTYRTPSAKPPRRSVVSVDFKTQAAGDGR